ncbi:MAG TPA: hypothetical protein VFU80_06500 [Sphingomicrobium sp.]|nr:hypothetical protein [Sphingomicrobium sp.]
MTRIPLLLTFAAAAALAGCNNEDHTIVAGPNTEDNAVSANGPVTLPPSISASNTYRCKDNSIVHVDWMSDNKTAIFRDGDDGARVSLAAPEAGQPMTAEGYSLTGNATASSVTVTSPGKGTRSCRV